MQSHPVDTEVAYWEDQDGAEEWNEIRQVVEPRHLARRSPICKRSASPCIIKKSKKLLLKAKKLKPIWKPKAKKLAKKLAIVGIPTAAALSGGVSLPTLPALPALPPLAELGIIGAVGGGAGGLGATFGPPIARQLSSTFG